MADYETAEVITPELYNNLVATGFLRTAPDRTFANITNFVPERLEVIADEIQIFGSAVLGDGKIYCASDRGEVTVIAANADTMDQASRIGS